MRKVGVASSRASSNQPELIDINDPESVKPEELVNYDIQHGEAILFKTRNSSRILKGDAGLTRAVLRSI